jgi:hypothetical protein
MQKVLVAATGVQTSFTTYQIAQPAGSQSDRRYHCRRPSVNCVARTPSTQRSGCDSAENPCNGGGPETRNVFTPVLCTQVEGLSFPILTARLSANSQKPPFVSGNP